MAVGRLNLSTSFVGVPDDTGTFEDITAGSFQNLWKLAEHHVFVIPRSAVALVKPAAGGVPKARFITHEFPRAHGFP